MWSKVFTAAQQCSKIFKNVPNLSDMFKHVYVLLSQKAFSVRNNSTTLLSFPRLHDQSSLLAQAMTFDRS